MRFEGHLERELDYLETGRELEVQRGTVQGSWDTAAAAVGAAVVDAGYIGDADKDSDAEQVLRMGIGVR